MKVALVYDRVNKWGGAERVLLTLHEMFPDAPLFTSVYNPDTASWARVFDIKTSFLQYFPFAASKHEIYAPLMPFVFESFSFDEYDLVISVTSEAAKGIVTKPNTKHVCYILTPTRYLWSGYNEYFNFPLIKIILQPIISYLRSWDLIASSRPDTYVSISKEVEKRVKEYYGRESNVIYPPVDLGSNEQHLETSLAIWSKRYPLDTNGYFLVVSRLVPYKRVDLVIKVCNNLGLVLKIIGTGSEEAQLRRIAGKTVEFLGNLTDEELVHYYKWCRAFIFAGKEDFGLSMVEAQLFGKPVIAYKSGGAEEIVISGKTGIFFEDQSIEALSIAINEFKKTTFHPIDCIKNAERFGKKKFLTEFSKKIKELTE